MTTTAKRAVKRDLTRDETKQDHISEPEKLIADSQAFSISAIAVRPLPKLAVEHAAIKRIDDAVIAEFNLTKFNDIRFTLGKRISLFFEHTFPFIVQSLFVPIFHVIYRCFFVIEINGKEKLQDIQGPVLFISNHIGFYDSFMFDMFVKPFSHILPFRFMGAKVFLSPFMATLKFIGIVDLIYLLFGVFRVTRGEGAEKSLKKAYEIIKDGGTVAMFPEGKIWRPNAVHPERIGPFKWGAAILAKNTNVQVVPVALRKTDNEYKFKDHMRITIGEPFRVDRDKAPEKIAEEMRLKVLSLYEDGGDY